MQNQRVNRRALGRWVGWFLGANALLYYLITLNYLFYLPDFGHIPLMTTQGTLLGWVFMLTGLLGQAAIFALVSILPVALLMLLIPRRGFVYTLGVLTASTMALFLIVDSVIYHLYHYHLAGVVWHVIRAGVATQVLELSWKEWALTALIALLLIGLEIMIAWAVARWVARKSRYQGWQIGVVLAASLFLSYTLTLSSGASSTADASAQSNDHVLVMESQIIPYYNFVLGQFMSGHNASLKLETRDDGYFVQNAQINKPLNYPLHPLQCTLPQKPYNIVMIVLDAWRFNMLNQTVTPHLTAFSKNAWVFEKNISGGNSTQPGIFSLFYGIPANYWTAMLAQHQGPVLIHQLIQDQYQMGIFRSASLHYPAFDQTVFREVKDLQIDTPGDESFDRDRQITKEFKQFINHRKPKKPFFGLVFYDETHNYCESSARYDQPFQPAIKVCNRLLLKNNSDPTPYLNRYRNAAHFDDALANQVLTALQKNDLLKNTIVIITADHGEEFNESHHDFWGHASDYTPWQTHTPMIVYWPQSTPQTFNYPTSHYDVVPTLMTKALGCTNSPSDYSIGHSLLSVSKDPFVIVNSYIDYGIVQPNEVTRIYPDGNYAIVSTNGSPLMEAKLNMSTLKGVFAILNRYFQ